jgi:CRP/FNR family cyclic AMP-dependent transcriptional regulator
LDRAAIGARNRGIRGQGTGRVERRSGKSAMDVTRLLIEAIGYMAAAANAYAYVSNTMIPLRIAAILANALFSWYFFMKGVYPLCAFNAMLLPLNVWRLLQMQRLISAVHAATHGEFHPDWLRPYMRPKSLPEGVTLYRKGDLSDAAYVIVKGRIDVPEKEVTLGPGALFGEIGLFADENRRTASAVAASDVELLSLRYSDLMQLATQNPQFGFYLMRLMVRRMQHNVELAQSGRG